MPKFFSLIICLSLFFSLFTVIFADDKTTAGGISCGDDKNPGIVTAIGCVHTKPDRFMADILEVAMGIGGGIAFLLMIFGAFGMITSAGNAESLKAGQERFTSAIIGLLFIVFSVLLMQIIGVDILGNITGFTKWIR